MAAPRESYYKNTYVGAAPAKPGAQTAKGNIGRQARNSKSNEARERKRSSMGKSMYYYVDKKGRQWFSEPLKITNAKGQEVGAAAVRKAINRASIKG